MMKTSYNNSVEQMAQAAACASCGCASCVRNTALNMDTAILAVSIFVYALISLCGRISSISEIISGIIICIISSIIMHNYTQSTDVWISA